MGRKVRHDELLAKLTDTEQVYAKETLYAALRAVVTLHAPIYDNSCFDLDCCGGPYPDLCDGCEDEYPCATIQAIEKELN
jgi:hypothetical protein